MEPLMILLAAVLLTATGTDLRKGRIPNWLTFSAMGLALSFHAWLGGFPGILFALAGLGVGLGFFLLLYASGSIGAGDVKLMASIGAILGAYGAVETGILAICVGGVYALGAMCYQWGFLNTGRKLVHAIHGAVLTGSAAAFSHELALPFTLRYGIAIAGGTLLFALGLHPFGG